MKIMLCKLGSEDKGFIPSKKMFDQFKTALQDAIDNKGNAGSVLLSHPFITVKEIEVPDGAKVVCVNDVVDEGSVWGEKMENIEKRMLGALERQAKDMLEKIEDSKPWWRKVFSKGLAKK